MYDPFSYLGWGALWGVLMGLIVFLVIIGILFYVLYALGLYTIAKRRGIENPWLAWIPVANIWLLGKIGDTYNERVENKKSNMATLMLVFSILVIVLSLIPVIGFLGVIFGIVLAVFEFIALYKIYNWTTRSAVLLTVLSVIFSIIIPFVIFFNRNGENPDLVYNGSQQPPQQQQPQGGDGQPPQDGPSQGN